MSISFHAAHQDECPEELISENFINFDEIMAISAKEGRGVDEVKGAIRNVLDKHALKRLEESTKDEKNTNKLRST